MGADHMIEIPFDSFENPHADYSATKNESYQKCLSFTIVFEAFIVIC